MKTVNAIAKINLKQTKAAYLTVGICFASTIVNTIICAATGTESGFMPYGNYMYLLPLLMAILIPARNFAKLMNLGGKRMDFFKGSLVTYAAAVAFAALFGIVAYYSADHYLIGTQTDDFSLNLLDVFGFMERGAGVAFFQMLAFLFLAASIAHTLTLAQGRWYGWVADVLIIAIISVFTPIAPLRAALVWFFNMIIFHDIAIVQIASCLVLGAALCALSLFPIRSKQV
jgi:hypothetical protein